MGSRSRAAACMMRAMKNAIWAVVAIAVATFAGCAGVEQKPAPPVLKRLAEVGVDPGTCARIANGRVLTYNEILGLVNKRVPGQVIVPYLKSTHAPYHLTDAQLQALTNAGAGPVLVNYLGKSAGYYEATRRDQTGGTNWDQHPYFLDPYYGGVAPFDFGFPAEWYDPAAFGMMF